MNLLANPIELMKKSVRLQEEEGNVGLRDRMGRPRRKTSEQFWKRIRTFTRNTL